MSIEIIVPRLGWSMEEGTFSRWLKQEGELIREGDELFELEGDKATQVVESFDSGVLHINPDGPQPGDTVKVGDVLGHLQPASSRNPGTDNNTAVTFAVTEVLERVRLPSSMTSSSPVAEHKTTHVRGQSAVTPRAARLAASLGVNVEDVVGTGRGGRIRECDVRHAELSMCNSSDVESSPYSAPALAASQNRRIIAERMIAASQQSAAVTLMAQADASALIGFRDECKRSQAISKIPSFTGLFVKLSAAALEQHPRCRAQWINNSIGMPDGIHVSVAIDTPHGLVTPVIRDAVSLPLSELSERLSELIKLARAGRLSFKQLQGGVFTISNLGMSRVEAFTPILNLPQAMILGVGRISTAPVVKNGVIAAGQIVSLSLTFDHRVIDGAPAAAFLTTLCELIENPAGLVG